MRQICLSTIPSDPAQQDFKKVQICVHLYLFKLLEEGGGPYVPIVNCLAKRDVFLFASMSL
jgi:hypothetical protein